jgi:Ca-activated chloride channel family protein
LQERVLYDLGDARYRIGAAAVKDAPEKTIERWKAAIASYDGALKLSPKDADAKFNRDFVQRKLDALQNQQKNKPQDKPQPQDQKNDKGGKADKPSNGGKGDKANKDQNGSQGDKPDEGKDGKGGKPSSADQKGDQPGKPQPGKDGKNGSNSPPPATPNGSPSSNGEPQKPGDEKANGAPKAGQGQNGKPGTEAGQKAEPGSLSARDARALLGSLRGEERHVRFGNTTQPHSDDAPQKDW